MTKFFSSDILFDKKLLIGLLKKFILIPLFYLNNPTAFAQLSPTNSCRYLFEEPVISEDALEKSIERPFLNTLIQNQYSQRYDPEFLAFEKMKPTQKFQLAQEKLNKLGISNEVMSESFLGIFKKQKKILILPKQNGTPLNELAFTLKKQLNVDLVYNSYLLDKLSEAYFLPQTMELGLSDLIVFSGEPNITLYHEIRHASFTQKLLRGSPSLYEGHVINSGPIINAKFPYEKFLSFQEVSTYYQDSKYHLLAIKQPSFNKLPSEDKIRLVFDSQLMVKLAIKVLKLSLQRLAVANEILESKRGQIFVKKSFSKHKYIQVNLEEAQYKFLFSIPTNGYYRQGMEEDLLSLHLLKMNIDFKTKLEQLEEMNTQLENIRPF